MDFLQKARDFFKNDIYATETTGIIIDDVRENYARCSLEIDRRHMNAGNVAMGGAIFTLADFTFAVAANTNEAVTVSLSSNITFLTACRGKKLIAEAICEKSGRNTCSFRIDIHDDTGAHIASVSTLGFKK